jgi:hypothetical protein
MSPSVVVCLGLVALSSSVQAIALIFLLREGRRISTHLASIERDVRLELRNLVSRLSQIADDLAGLNDGTRRIEARVDAAVASLQRVAAVGKSLTTGSIEAFVPALGVVRGLRRGFQAYRALRGYRKALPRA